MMLVQKALAEMSGTFVMIFCGMGSILLYERYPQVFPSWGIPLAWGLAIALMIVVFGHVSGAHFNPAVTLVLTVMKRFPSSQVALYWFSQSVGGLTAIRVLTALQKI